MIVVILGLPGAGKSYLGEKVAKEYHALYLNSDHIRKAGDGAVGYDDIAKANIYKQMFSSMEGAVLDGKHVVLDATFYQKPLRKDLIAMAEKIKVPIYFIEVVASVKVTRERLKKHREYSDADFKVYEQVKQSFDPLEVAHLTLRSDRLSITEMLRQVKEYITEKENPAEQ